MLMSVNFCGLVVFPLIAHCL